MAPTAWSETVRGEEGERGGGGGEEQAGPGPPCQIKRAGPTCDRQRPWGTAHAEGQNDQITA